jgi:hypothetical protein
VKGAAVPPAFATLVADMQTNVAYVEQLDSQDGCFCVCSILKSGGPSNKGQRLYK